MKKVISIIIGLCLILSMSCSAFATDAEESVGINVLIGTQTTDYVDVMGVKATNAPSAFAPSSWYEVDHDWAAKNFTWSAYKFTNTDGMYVYITGQGSFDVQFYYADGTSMGTWSAYSVGSDYQFSAEMSGSNAGYYFRIINTSSLSPNSGRYSVYGYGS